LHDVGTWKFRVVLPLIMGTVVLLLALTGSVMVENGDSYDLYWWTVDGGGDTLSVGGGYSLGSAIGQPDAGPLIGGEYTLAGGFWNRSPIATNSFIYLPLVNLNH
jgi:hypothetical protein